MVKNPWVSRVKCVNRGAGELRKPESQRARGPESQKARKPEGRKLRLALLISIVPCVLYLAGCGSDPEEEQTVTPEENLQSGWVDYSSGNYGAAILAFEKVLADQGASGETVADAYNGLGWVYLGFSQSTEINQKNIAVALSKFQKSIAYDPANADAWVGQAGLLLARRSSPADLQDALKAVDNALQSKAEYLYRHDYDSEADLHILKAQCYYYLGETSKALDEINRVLAVEKDNRVALTMNGLL